MISQDSIQQIQSRLDIIEIVGGFVKLKKRGANYLGLCPFHNEKSPSFTVSPTKEIYKCFGCGKSGNTIGFLMEHEKYSYVEALRWLAMRYGVDLQETEASPEARLQQQAADSLYIINNFAKDFFEKSLFESEEGQDVALSYLKERGFREDILRKFQIGYDPASGNAFAAAAQEAQYNEDLLQKSGLVVLRNDRLQDNYRERIIFPIHNQSGKILGFGARLIKKNDRAPKYINTPENDIYVKSKILYGSYFARQAIDKADECLLVEGYTDVVSLHQAGIENVVASGGTSLTPDQLRLVKKYTNNLTIIYDGDSAGIKAALRGLDLALEEGLHVRLLLIPDGEDPDSYVNKVGASTFKTFIEENKKDFVLFQLEVSLKEAGEDSSKKLQVVNQVAETLAKINKVEEFTRRQDYIREVSSILKIEEAGLHNLVNKFVREKLVKDANRLGREDEKVDDLPAQEVDNDALLLLKKDEENEKGLIRSLIEFGDREWDGEHTVADYLIAEIETNELDKAMELPMLSTVYQIYKTLYMAGTAPSAKNFTYNEDQVMGNFVIDLMQVSNELSPNWNRRFEGKIPTRDELYKEEVSSTLQYLKLKKVKRLMEENQAQLAVTTDINEQILILQTQQQLKKIEQDITGKMGTVILK